MASADSTQQAALQKEMAAKIDSVNKINAPRLNEFIKGLTEAMNLEEKSAYANGLSIGAQFHSRCCHSLTRCFRVRLHQRSNREQVLAGIISTLKNQELAINKMEANEMVQTAAQKAQAAAQARQEEELKKQYADSIAAGDAFMAQNAKREGVITLPSGLQYEVIRAGNGPIPTDTDRVKVNYHGTLINGTVFDSSVERGEPAIFGVNQVIPGWTEALKLMPVGSKWRLYIPYELAYGSADRGTIKPFSNLIFEVELLGIENKGR